MAADRTVLLCPLKMCNVTCRLQLHRADVFNPKPAGDGNSPELPFGTSGPKPAGQCFHATCSPREGGLDVWLPPPHTARGAHGGLRGPWGHVSRRTSRLGWHVCRSEVCRPVVSPVGIRGES